MRELFEEGLGASVDPSESARAGSRPVLRKRFYKEAAVQPAENGFAVVLDGRPVRTPARRSLVAPQQVLAQAIAAEWQAQTDVIDPAGDAADATSEQHYRRRDRSPGRRRCRHREILRL